MAAVCPFFFINSNIQSTLFLVCKQKSCRPCRSICSQRSCKTEYIIPTSPSPSPFLSTSKSTHLISSSSWSNRS
jgi:hypothetical protein